MTDLPILTPSECAALAETLTSITPLPWSNLHDSLRTVDLPTSRDYIATVYYRQENGFANAIAIAKVMNVAPRMLATIAAHEATIGELKRQLEERT